MREMDADELMNWMAYEMTCDNDFKNKILRELALERSEQMSKEQRASALKELFKSMGGK